MIITSQKAKKAILAALGDEEMVKILDSVMDKAKSVNEIMREQKIPYTTAYRKTKWLLDEGLLVVSKIDITPDGKKSSLVYTVLKSITVRYQQHDITIEAEQNFDIVRRVMQKFFSME